MPTRPILFCILGCLGALLAPSSVAAQEFGAKGGLNWSSVSFDRADAALDVESRPGWLIGGFVTFNWLERLGLQVEGLYTQRKTLLEGVVTDDLRYVEIPMLARYRVLGKGSVRVFAVGGGSVAFLVRANESVGDESYDVKDVFESKDVGALVGADVEWKARWVFGVRYLYGVSDLFKSVPGEFQATQRAIQVTAGIRLR